MTTGDPGLRIQEPGFCCECTNPLPPRKKKYCSERCAKLAARRVHLWRCFRITLEEYDEILEEQDGGCATCHRPPKPGKSLAVDHDHRTGYIRGLLCFLCNKRFIGARSDGIIEAMYDYITDPPARRVLGDREAPGRPRKKRRSTVKRPAVGRTSNRRSR